MDMKALFNMARKTDLEEKKKLKAVHGADIEENILESTEVLLINGEDHHARTLQGKRKLTSEEYAEYKRRRKEKDRISKEWPRIFVNEQGKASSLCNENDCLPLFMGDIQSLMLQASLGKRTGLFPRWATIKNIGKVSNVVMVHIEGMGVDDIKQNALALSEENPTRNKVSSSGYLPGWLKSTLPRISCHMNHGLEIVAPSVHGLCPVEELLELKTEKSKKRIIEEDIKNYDKAIVKMKAVRATESFFKYLSKISPNPGDELHPNDKYSRLKLLLTPEELVKHRFPLPLPGYKASSNKEFVLTSDNYEEVTSRSPMFGLDCEMCLTSVGKLELTSISVVNENGQPIYHTLVLPYNEVVNFLTKFSGITPWMLQDVTKRLEDVQQDLQKLLPPNAILVGHSLQSDLTAMKMMHPYVIDSSLAYNLTGKRWLPTSLRVLSKIFLYWDIQTKGEGGHDPTEDAAASLMLIQMKLSQDETYGNVIMGWQPPSAACCDWEKVFEKPKRDSNEEDEEGRISAEEVMRRLERTKDKISTEEAIGPFQRTTRYIFETMRCNNVAIITTPRCFKKYLDVLPSLRAVTMEVLPGHKQISQRARDFVTVCDLTYVHLEMGKKLSWCPNKATRRRQLRKLDKRLRRIHQAANSKSIHIYVFSGSSLNVPLKERSHGLVLVGIKDLCLQT